MACHAQEIVCVKNANQFLPIDDIWNVRVIQVGGLRNMGFVNMAHNYARISYQYIKPNLNDVIKMAPSLRKGQSILLIASPLPKNILTKIDQIACRNRCCVINLNHRQNLNLLRLSRCILQVDDEDFFNCGQRAARAAFGGDSVYLKLDKTYGPNIAGQGDSIVRTRIKFSIGKKESELNRCYRDTIDSIIASAIDSCCFPGCQVFAIKNGKTIFDKAYGRFTYEPNSQMVTPEHLYDIASLSKVASTTMIAMYLHEHNRLKLNRTIGSYISDTTGQAQIMDVTVRALLEHKSGIYAYPPITRLSNLKAGRKIVARSLNMDPDTIKDKDLKQLAFNEVYTIEPQEGLADTRIAPGLWLKNNYRDTLNSLYLRQKMNKRVKYQYSDVNMIYMQMIEEKIMKMSNMDFISMHFYHPLGMRTTG